MDKKALIMIIRETFKDVTLEDGVGLWEAQGLDDYADDYTMKELRKKDERNDWFKIPSEQLIKCYSSLSFFDARGMRFHLPAFMICELTQDNAPDISFVLGYDMQSEYQKERFSLLNQKQIHCIVYFLEYKINTLEKKYLDLYGSDGGTLSNDLLYGEISKSLQYWQQKLSSVENGK